MQQIDHEGEYAAYTERQAEQIDIKDQGGSQLAEQTGCRQPADALSIVAIERPGELQITAGTDNIDVGLRRYRDQSKNIENGGRCNRGRARAIAHGIRIDIADIGPDGTRSGANLHRTAVARKAADNILEPGIARTHLQVKWQIDDAAQQFADHQIQFESPLRRMRAGPPFPLSIQASRTDGDAWFFQHAQRDVQAHQARQADIEHRDIEETLTIRDLGGQGHQLQQVDPGLGSLVAGRQVQFDQVTQLQG